MGSNSCELVKGAVYYNIKDKVYNGLLNLFYSYGIHPPESEIEDASYKLAYNIAGLRKMMCLASASGYFMSTIYRYVREKH